MLFAGFICLYIFGGIVYGALIDSSFDYTISFVHLAMGIGFTLTISLLWGLFFGQVVIKDLEFLLRYLLFDVSVGALLLSCFFLFSITSMEGSVLWFVVASVIVIFVVVLAALSWWYFNKTGEHYTDLLKAYQSKMNGQNPS